MTTLLELSQQSAHVVATASQSVATVYGQMRRSASGILWQPNVVVTVNHLLERDDELRVTLSDGVTVEAELVGRDPTTNLAVLRIESQSSPAAHIGDPTNLRLGEFVVAIGRSGESGTTASFGIIGSLGGSWQTRRGGLIDQFIQADLNLYPRFSGGPLVNLQAEVIGLNSVFPARRREFTLPSTTVKRVVVQLLNQGRVNRGYLGVGMQPVQIPTNLKESLNLTTDKGVLIVSLEPDAPADQAGVYIGDIWITFDGQSVTDSYDVLAALTSERIGQTVPIQAIRAGSLVATTVTITSRSHT